MFHRLFALSFSTLACILPSVSAYAENDLSCKVEVAVATPPVQLTQNVAFNITPANNDGSSKSLTVRGGSAPQIIDGIACFFAYNISATAYSTPSIGVIRSSIGECTLKGGNLFFNNSGDNISVVFPNDFICNQVN
ncbi:hypothetical protein [Legionella cardiaca]|uniref:Secreted protein n=1 Tax=Legionella cardiaca TaxID=1071983 RepID=A0ABY8APL9_9GAMM|nr:hypothetical protein [Legionella cardiaca]WED42191.1 hypothetical protein PXX05_09640 [Legionella cardiaca]